MNSLKLIIGHLLLVLITDGFVMEYEESVNIENTKRYKGMNLVAPVNELKKSTLTDLKVNNINAISLIPYAFVNTDKITISYDNGKQWWGETTEGIKECARLAHSENFSVMLKPHLWINHNSYTGDLDFKNIKEWEKWEVEYEKYILHFAKIAQSEKIELFCLGTELRNSIAKRSQFWLQLIKKIRGIYSGNLTYAANWDDYEKVPFWDKMDYIGIDAYFPLSKSKTPSINELKSSWKVHILNIEKIQKKQNKKVIFTEYGYRNADYSANEPWSETNMTENNQAQSNSYEALFQTIKNKSWYMGGFAWKWYADDYHKKKKTIDFTPQNKPALEVIKRHYKN